MDDYDANLSEVPGPPSLAANAIRNAYLPNIYEHSHFKVFSKIVQHLLPRMGVVEQLLNVLKQNSGIEKVYLFDFWNKIFLAEDSSPADCRYYDLCADMLDLVVHLSDYSLEATSGSFPSLDTSATVRLDNGAVLYLQQVHKYLAALCIIREENFDRKGIIDYNFTCFQKGFADVIKILG